MLDRLSFSASATSGGVTRGFDAAASQVGRSLERLSSGYRINHAGDDPAGMAVSNKLATQVRGLAQANANAQDAINLLQTADGGLNETTAILQRMRELVVQAGNDTYTQTDRGKIQAEIEQLKANLTDIAKSTQFNGRTLLDGSIAASRFAEPNGAYIRTNPTIGIPGDSGPWISDLNIRGPGFEDVIWSMTISSTLGPTLAGSPYYLSSVTITDSSGFVGGASSYNDFFPNSSTNFGTFPAHGWGVSIVWGPHHVYPTTDASKTFVMFLDHHLSAVTIDRGIEMQVGSDSGQTMRLGIRGVSADDLRLESVSVLATTEAGSHVAVNQAMREIDAALGLVNVERSRIGGWQSRLEHTVQNTSQSEQQQAASQSQLADTDFAKETAALTRSQVLQQAATGLLAQANAVPQMALKLLKGEL